jgi:hypothetical protein
LKQRAGSDEVAYTNGVRRLSGISLRRSRFLVGLFTSMLAKWRFAVILASEEQVLRGVDSKQTVIIRARDFEGAKKKAPTPTP